MRATFAAFMSARCAIASIELQICELGKLIAIADHYAHETFRIAFRRHCLYGGRKLHNDTKAVIYCFRAFAASGNRRGGEQWTMVTQLTQGTVQIGSANDTSLANHQQVVIAL